MSNNNRRMDFNQNPIEQRPIQEAIEIIKDKLGRAVYRTTYFLGFNPYDIFHRTGMPNQWGLDDIKYRLSETSFIPDNFLCIKWNKKIEVTHDNEASNVNEDRRLNLYNPFKIKTFYGLNAPDKMVGDETHEFYRKVIRVKFLWWNDYRIVSTWTDDTTEFDRALDNYLTGGNC
mgnify:CR=1 FL=1